ncbi:uncharacterized protein LOC118789480 [Megalops cyprinoides]|uniref:uncharacterized protein LOC118789480 n=1 Tax=Megalops cyprinoides TaxID=118141 RepID=UPI001864BA10|nr:uncharacterized protein LOC118789480 [Megalops cyprinoides]
MRIEFCTLLLLFPLALSLKTDFQVSQPQTQVVGHNGSVTIACELRNGQANWTMDTKLKRKSNDSVVCQASTRKSRDCIWRQEVWNRTLFTLFNVQPGDEELYVCELARTSSRPILTRKGNGTLLIPDTTVTPVSLKPRKSQCSDASPFNWILIGLVVFFCISNLIATSAYIKLRILHGKQIEDPPVYVPMQGRAGPQRISDYMNFQKVHPEGRISDKVFIYNPYYSPD